MNVLARGKIHHRVRPPPNRPTQLLHLILNRRRHRTISNVRIDLYQEVPPNDHRL